MDRLRKIEREITEEFILEEYNRICNIRNKEKREEELKALAVLAQHVGEYLTIER
jgi:hypothetical protein|tara:strand:- start:17153 stop:17317 length:165 start_codon:yes stop_codon:yes gene_type:complete